MTPSDGWYVVKQPDGHCDILAAAALAATPETGDRPVPEATPAPETWGPFGSQAEAIARRVGLIRSGKCQPL